MKALFQKKIRDVAKIPFLASFFLMTFFISADGLTINVGRNWQISQLITISIFFLLFLKHNYEHNIKIKAPKVVFLVLFVFITLVVISILFMPPSPKYIPSELSYWEQYGISSYMYLFWILLDVMMFLVVYKMLKSKSVLVTTVRLIVYSSVIFSLYGIFQYTAVELIGPTAHAFIFSANYEYLREGYTRLMSSAREPLYYACYLNFVLGIMVPKLNSHSREIYGIEKKYWLLIFSVNLLALILTKSLGGFIGFIAIIFVNSVIAIRLNDVKMDYRFFRKIFFLICAVSAFIFINFSSIDSKVTRMMDPESGYGRIISIIQAIDLISENPFLGIGMGNSVFFVSNHQIHNAYFNIATELGLLGILTFLVFIFLILKGLYDISSTELDQDLKYISVGLICSICGIMTQLLSFYAYMINLIWFMLGMAIGVIKLAKNKKLKIWFYGNSRY